MVGIVKVILQVTLKAERVVMLLFGIFHKISLFFIEYRFHCNTESTKARLSRRISIGTGRKITLQTFFSQITFLTVHINSEWNSKVIHSYMLTDYTIHFNIQ